MIPFRRQIALLFLGFALTSVPSIVTAQTPAGNWNLSPWNFNGSRINAPSLKSNGARPIGLAAKINSIGSGSFRGASNGTATSQYAFLAPPLQTTIGQVIQRYAFSSPVNFGANQGQFRPKASRDNGIGARLAIIDESSVVTSCQIMATLTGGAVFTKAEASNVNGTSTLDSGLGTSTVRFTFIPLAVTSSITIGGLTAEGNVKTFQVTHQIFTDNPSASSAVVLTTVSAKINTLTSPLTSAPTIRFTGRNAGKSTIRTTNPKLRFQGRATSKVSRVFYRAGSTKRRASGTNSWRFTANLKPGRNVITVTARGPGGNSKPIRVTVIRS